MHWCGANGKCKFNSCNFCTYFLNHLDAALIMGGASRGCTTVLCTVLFDWSLGLLVTALIGVLWY